MEPSIMMPKSDTIEAIQRLNPTASPEFLAGFSADDLARYLDRLADRPARRIDEPDESAEIDELSLIAHPCTYAS